MTWRVVSVGWDLGDIAPSGLVVEHWDDVPSPGADLTRALASITTHVGRLVETLAWEGCSQPCSASASEEARDERA